MFTRLRTVGTLVIALLIVVSVLPAYAVRTSAVAEAPALARDLANQLSSVQTGAVNKSLPALSEDEPATFIVQLEDEPLSNYGGGIAGLAGTSAAATGSVKLNVDSAASRRYISYLDQQRATVLNAIAPIVGGSATPEAVYRNVFNGFALRLTPAQAAQIATLPGVKRVERDRIYELQTDTGPNFIGAAQPNAKPRLFNADLSGSAVPQASGEAVVTYDASTQRLSFRVFFSELSGAPTMAHFHLGAPGSDGPAVVDISDTLVSGSGVYSGEKTVAAAGGKTLAEIEAALYAGNLYLNIHTSANPSGEIRGQVEPNQGEGMIIGVLDSGINIDNPSFQDVGGDGYDHTNPLGSGTYLGVCDPAHSTYDDTFPCNDKVIGAYTFPSTANAPDPQDKPSPRDEDGHGSHTASTAGGNVLNGSSLNGVSTGPISGVAPHANLIIYDVCGTATSSGCPGLAILAAINQAAADGVDVVNMSLGSTSYDPWSNPVAIALANAISVGMSNSLSAGNSGPDPETIGSSGDAPWAISVAASTHDRVYTNSVTDFSGGSSGTRPTAAIVGKGVTPGLAATSIVYAGNTAINNPLCGPFSSAQAALVAGKIVLCDRGTYGRVEKSYYVAVAGGEGYILANNAASGSSLVGDAFVIPGVHITYADGVALKAWATGCSNCQVAISGATRELLAEEGDIIASFSSRGPNPSVPDVLKPNVSAPGVDILAATADFDSEGADYEFLSGTSMAAPHVAGAVALVRQVHPNWSVMEVASALMTTATSEMLKEDGSTPADPFDMGSGRIRVDQAIKAGLVLNETVRNFGFADPFYGGDPTTLNLASAANSACIVECSFVRTVRSTLPVPVTWSASVAADTALNLSVNPASFTIAPGATQSFTITADVESGALDAYLFGAVTLMTESALAPAATFPVAVQPVASNLPEFIDLTVGSPDGATEQEVTTIAISELTVATYGLVKVTPTELSLDQDTTPGDPTDVEAGGVLTQTLIAPAGTTRIHVSLADATAPDLDLYVFIDFDGDGIPSDEELVCVSATGGSDERCEITANNLATGIGGAIPLTVLVQNYEGSGADEDTFTLYTGVVGTTNSGGLEVTGPATNPAGGSFALNLAWDLSTPDAGDRYIGLFGLASAAAAPKGELGFSLVTIVYEPEASEYPHIDAVSPEADFNDIPVELTIEGSNFVDGAVVSLGSTELETSFIDSEMLLAVVPFAQPTGTYSVTVTNPNGDAATLADAYTALDPETSNYDDLFSSDGFFWVDPLPVRVGTEVQFGLFVLRSGGETLLEDIPVEFRSGSITGTLLGSTTVPLLEPDGGPESTVLLATTFQTAGEVTIYAIIDPGNTAVPEGDEGNNVYQRTIVVEPAAAPEVDTTKPTVNGIQVNGRDTATTTSRAIIVGVDASDPAPEPVSGVRHAHMIEYVYLSGIGSWVPVAQSGWQPFGSSPQRYPWTLSPQPGARYLQVRARDEAGNVSTAVARLLNYTPTSDSILQGQTRIYRYAVPAGQELQVSLDVTSGDADVYVWSQAGLAGYGQNGTGVDELVTVPASSQAEIYQIEVYGYTAVSYGLSVTIGGAPAAAPARVGSGISQGKTPPTAPLVGISSSPSPLVGNVPSAPAPVQLNNRVYVPLVAK